MNNWGNWQWGEDMWLDQCLLTVAHTKRIYVGQMLAEDHCNKWPGWDQCNSQEIVAYHPYKSADSYIACTATGLTTTATTSRTLTWTTTGTTVTVTQTTTTVSNMNPVQQLENMLGSLFRH
ncbi:unnamed protein product [Durusdinium trenchii]|uniref:Uncharacterized protein n=1 Tax=Durusdinium trenchii TaxID=1381693 RepID=A0ABP0P549_9DINO